MVTRRRSPMPYHDCFCLCSTFRRAGQSMAVLSDSALILPLPTLLRERLGAPMLLLLFAKPFYISLRGFRCTAGTSPAYRPAHLPLPHAPRQPPISSRPCGCMQCVCKSEMVLFSFHGEAFGSPTPCLHRSFFPFHDFPLWASYSMHSLGPSQQIRINRAGILSTHVVAC